MGADFLTNPGNPMYYTQMGGGASTQKGGFRDETMYQDPPDTPLRQNLIKLRAKGNNPKAIAERAQLTGIFDKNEKAKDDAFVGGLLGASVGLVVGKLPGGAVGAAAGAFYGNKVGGDIAADEQKALQKNSGYCTNVEHDNYICTKPQLDIKN